VSLLKIDKNSKLLSSNRDYKEAKKERKYVWKCGMGGVD
jgi:hypothetical protein